MCLACLTVFWYTKSETIMASGASLTQEEVARALEWSPSKLIRVEGGHSSITRVDLDALLSRYGVPSDDDRERLQELNRGAKAPSWWDSYRNDIAAPYLNYVGYEAGASSIRQFPGTVVPGLLQTTEYAEALTTSAVDAIDVAPVVKLRIQRQSELAQRSHPPRQEYVLDEAVIRRHIGIDNDPGIMPNQLHLIADTAARSELITVRVIPFKAGAHQGCLAPSRCWSSRAISGPGLPDPGGPSSLSALATARRFPSTPVTSRRFSTCPAGK